MAMSESARMATAEEARFRINAPNSKPRIIRIVALDQPAEETVRRLSMSDWKSASFYSAARYNSEAKDIDKNGWFCAISGEAQDAEAEIASADLVVMIGSVGQQEDAARKLSEICRARNVMTTALVVGDQSKTDAALSKTLAQLRPYALMLVIASAEDYVEDMLSALRA
ncbi:MAG TPA: hypothetical protein VL402_09710 [Xanthobacteraceae bacterium]|jgi:hypothetical protein|nr:hypothetical protein [Xanthobacteraceae bacterium]